MNLFLVVIHVIVSIALIMIVLLQTGKGADMGAAFGGGASQTLFGTTGASTFLGKLTTIAAIVFMLTSLTLAYMAGHRNVQSVVEKAPVTAPQTDSSNDASKPATESSATAHEQQPVAPDSEGQAK